MSDHSKNREMPWIDAWNDLYDLTNQRDDFPCILPDGTCITAAECRGSIQQAVYEGRTVHLARGWHQGRPAVIVAFTRTSSEFPSS